MKTHWKTHWFSLRPYWTLISEGGPSTWPGGWVFFGWRSPSWTLGEERWNLRGLEGWTPIARSVLFFLWLYGWMRLMDKGKNPALSNFRYLNMLEDHPSRWLVVIGGWFPIATWSVLPFHFPTKNPTNSFAVRMKFQQNRPQKNQKQVCVNVTFLGWWKLRKTRCSKGDLAKLRDQPNDRLDKLWSRLESPGR